VGTSASLHHAHMLNNNVGAGGAALPMSGVVPLAEPPPKRQKTVNLQVNSLLTPFRPSLLRCGSCFLPCPIGLLPSVVAGAMPAPALALWSSMKISSQYTFCFHMELESNPLPLAPQDNAGTSLLEAFSAEEIRMHMQSLALNPQACFHSVTS